MRAIHKKINVPTEWSMFTPEGNRRVRNMAILLKKDCEEGVTFARALKKYFMTMFRMATGKGFREVDDTAVRERIIGFAITIGRYIVGYGQTAAEDKVYEIYNKVFYEAETKKEDRTMIGLPNLEKLDKFFGTNGVPEGKDEMRAKNFGMRKCWKLGATKGSNCGDPLVGCEDCIAEAERIAKAITHADKAYRRGKAFAHTMPCGWVVGKPLVTRAMKLVEGEA